MNCQLNSFLIQKGGKVLLWNQVKSRMGACYFELVLVDSTHFQMLETLFVVLLHSINIPWFICFKNCIFKKSFTPLCLLCNFLQLVAYVIHDILTCLGNISRPFSLNYISDLNYEIILPRWNQILQIRRTAWRLSFELMMV